MICLTSGIRLQRTRYQIVTDSDYGYSSEIPDAKWPQEWQDLFFLAQCVSRSSAGRSCGASYILFFSISQLWKTLRFRMIVSVDATWFFGSAVLCFESLRNEVSPAYLLSAFLGTRAGQPSLRGPLSMIMWASQWVNDGLCPTYESLYIYQHPITLSLSRSANNSL